MIVKTFGIVELLPDGSSFMIDTNWNQTLVDAEALKFPTKQEASDFAASLQGTYQVKTFLEDI